MSSIMDLCPILACVGSKMRVSTWMGSFGALTPKPTWLLGNAPWMTGLHRKLSKNQRFPPNDTVVHLPGSSTSGRSRRVQGGPGLKETQAYPKEYGQAVYNAWQEGTASMLGASASDGSESECSVSDSEYVEMDHGVAEIHEVCDFFSVPTTEWMFDRRPC